MVVFDKHPKILSLIRENFFIMLGLALYAVAWNMFIKPHELVGGGLGGISIMIEYISHVPMWITYAGVNIVLCIIAYLVLGKDFSIKTIYGIAGLTVFLAVIPSPDPSVPSQIPISNTLLSCVMGGIIAGVGIASYLMQGASTGGSDIIVMIISKFKSFSWGTIYVMFDAFVISSSFFLPEGSLEKVAYGFVFMGVCSYTMDLIHNGMRSSVQMFIFTTKYNEIANQIIHKHHRGATLFESIGWYTKQHRKTVYLVARRREAQAIYKTVKAIDAHAFIAVSNVKSVFGIGFDQIKAGFTKAHMTDANGNPIAVDPQTGQPVAIDAVTGKPIDNEELTSEKIIAQNRIEKAAANLTNPDPDDKTWIPEVTADAEILTDEIISRELEKQGLAATYNPNWSTPISELNEIPEMPRIPNDEVSNIRHSPSTDGISPVQHT